jgi:two-component system chemotaxis sensor kinase CheA
MGGAIRLSSRAGHGFIARLDVPIESGLVSMLWVTAGDQEYALPALHVRRVRLPDTENGPESTRIPHLLTCLDAPPPAGRGPEQRDETTSSGGTGFVLDLELEGDDESSGPASLGVDAVGRTEELLVRPLGPLVAGLGPFAGAIVRGDGSLRLALDAWALAPRARAFGRRRSASGRPPASVR